jgi:hypothetical protein
MCNCYDHPALPQHYSYYKVEGDEEELEEGWDAIV